MKNRPIQRRWRSFLVDQDGAVGIVIALLLPILFGFAGLAVDKGHEHAVRSQLKNAADAGALSGARALLPYTGTPPSTPNWGAGQTKAIDTVKLNFADGKQLSDCPVEQVEHGYWRFTTTPPPPPLLSAGIIPTANDFPAVSVKVSKTTGQNDGPVKRYLATVLNVIPGVSVEPTVDMNETSVAVVVPKSMGIGGLKPMVATTAILQKYGGSSGNIQFQLGEPNVQDIDKSINDTMWTTFNTVDPNPNSNALTKELIANGNPDPVWIGDMIHLQPGVRAVDYGPNEMGKFLNTTVVVPIVAPETLVANTDAKVLGFVAFHITGWSQGGTQGGLATEKGDYVMGYFDKDYVITNPQGSTIPQGLDPPPFFQLVN